MRNVKSAYATHSVQFGGLWIQEMAYTDPTSESGNVIKKSVLGRLVLAMV